MPSETEGICREKQMAYSTKPMAYSTKPIAYAIFPYAYATCLANNRIGDVSSSTAQPHRGDGRREHESNGGRHAASRSSGARHEPTYVGGSITGIT